MKLLLRILVLCLVLFPLLHEQTWSWGFFGHKRINRMAVFTLPPAMVGFYKKHIDYITEHAVDPDKRRYGVEGEAPRHYIDIDHYSEEKPFEVVPRRWSDAVEKFTEDTLQAYGIVPWHLEVMLGRLTRAFKAEDFDRILRMSAELGHYVGDAHVPLHTTENYNGQLTGQRGIHGFWESRLPELYAEEFDYLVGRVAYLETPSDMIWEAIRGSHHALDSVLDFERELNRTFPQDKKYVHEERGAALIKTYSREYSNAYHTMLDGMVERRMRLAIYNLGSMWYTAWVNAGQPDLARFEDKELSKVMKERVKQEQEQWEQRQKIQGRDHGQ